MTMLRAFVANALIFQVTLSSVATDNDPVKWCLVAVEQKCNDIVSEVNKIKAADEKLKFAKNMLANSFMLIARTVCKRLVDDFLVRPSEVSGTFGLVREAIRQRKV